jgi:hypothetical protein
LLIEGPAFAGGRVSAPPKTETLLAIESMTKNPETIFKFSHLGIAAAGVLRVSVHDTL